MDLQIGDYVTSKGALPMHQSSGASGVVIKIARVNVTIESSYFQHTITLKVRRDEITTAARGRTITYIDERSPLWEKGFRVGSEIPAKSTWNMEEVGQHSKERVIDGMGAEPVVMVKAPIVVPSCGPGKHCTAHGAGPYFCCRCGAHFEEHEA